MILLLDGVVIAIKLLLGAHLVLVAVTMLLSISLATTSMFIPITNVMALVYSA